MRIFQSFWTKPALDKRWDQAGQLEANVWLFALSAVHAKRQGVTLVLYTDTLGQKLLGHLPYDKIYTTLNNIPSNIPTMIWAYGKFMALKEEPIGSIHIDGDVFLKSPKIINEFNFKGYDLIVQNREYTMSTYSPIEATMVKYGELNKSYFDSYKEAFNCGTVGFNNEKLKKEYLDFYFKSTSNIAQNRAMKEYMAKNRYFCVDLPLEQHSLALLARPYKAKIVLKGNNGNEFWSGDTRVRASELGYQHLIGKDKYSLIERVKFNLLALDKDMYFKTKAAIQKNKNILT